MFFNKHHHHQNDPFVTPTRRGVSPLRTRSSSSMPLLPLFPATGQDQTITTGISNAKYSSLYPREEQELAATAWRQTFRIGSFKSLFGKYRSIAAWIQSRFQRRQTLLQRFQKKILLPFLLSLMIICCNISEAWAVPGGRVGGSFGKSSSSSHSSSSYSRPSMSRPNVQYRNSAPRVTIVRPPTTQLYYNLGNPYDYSTRSSSVVEVSRGFSVSDVVILTGVGLVMANGFRSNDRRDRKDDGRSSSSSSVIVLGPGYTVATLTVALNIPNRHDPNSILNKIHRLSQSARTDTRRGVQELMSTVAMELLRQERSIISVRTDSQHVGQFQKAQQIFHQISTRERSKFDRESVNRFGGVDQSDVSSSSPSSLTTRDDDMALSSPTLGIVSMTISIEGDQTMLPTVKTRSQLRDALSRIAADAQVGECLLAGEVLWAPEANSSESSSAETLTPEEVMADYPDLLTIL